MNNYCLFFSSSIYLLFIGREKFTIHIFMKGVAKRYSNDVFNAAELLRVDC